MSDEEFGLALAQKYRLAISLAVLKTKPENLTITEYINEIRDVIIDRNKDTSGQDLDMTACSDDFNLDDDDEITKIDFPLDFLHDFCDQNVKSVSNDSQNDRNNSNNNNVEDNEWHIDNNYRIDDKLTDNGQVSDKAVIINQIDCREVNSKGIEISEDNAQDIDMTQDNNRLHESAHRLLELENKTQTNGETEKSDPNKERKNKFREVIRILKGVDASTEKVVKEKPITTPGIIKSFDPTDLDLTQYYDDTPFYNMQIHAEAECQSIDFQDQLKNKQIYDTMEVCNSVMPSNVPDEIVTLVPSKERPDVRKRKTDDEAQKNVNTDAKFFKMASDDNTVKINLLNVLPQNSNEIENNHKKADDKDHNTSYFALNTPILDHKRINHMEVTNNTVKNGDTDSVGVTNTQDTQSNTHYSESQMFDIVINKNFIYGNRNQNFGINAETNKLIDKDYGNTNPENIDNRRFSIITHKTNDLPKSQNITNKTTQNEFAVMAQYQDAFSSQGFDTQNDNRMETGEALAFDTNDRNNKVNNTELTIDILRNDRKTINDLCKDKNNVTNKHMFQIHTEREDLFENCTAFSQTQDMSLTQNALSSTQIYEDNGNAPNKDIDLDAMNTENENDCTDFDNSKETDDPETIEKVPFKIIEEMSQIKSYLSKKREFKDSGYKSSQSQRSGIGTQASSVRVGESANSVFLYLSSCPLDVATQELTEQISEVLGQIIDRLHIEEIYPNFLEELLNTVEKLLHLLHEEESYDFDVLQKKDEQIQRIILLNKSTNINKFTIEKINDILQKLINDISDTKYEIQEINKLENLCYIFHVLQIILPKYKQGYLCNSQESQSSQGQKESSQKLLKKQDISDIWRRKWFTDTKEEENEGSFENKCVLKECGAILNKIIVDFMDGYSLIAFAALKCFNLIQ